MKTLLDAKNIKKVLEKMSREMVREGREGSLALVGICSRGVPLASRLAELIGKKIRKKIPVGILDITLYRDDLSRLAYHPVVKKTEIPFLIDDAVVYLVDDVVYTGRTIRCALDALFDFGRPRAVKLAVLVDRGGREIPIQADVIGMTYKVGAGENVSVHLTEVDGKDEVVVEKNHATQQKRPSGN